MVYAIIAQKCKHTSSKETHHIPKFAVVEYASMVFAVEKDGNEPPFLSDSLVDAAHPKVLPPILPLYTNMCGVWNHRRLAFAKIFQMYSAVWLLAARPRGICSASWLAAASLLKNDGVCMQPCERVCCFRQVPKAKTMQWSIPQSTGTKFMAAMFQACSWTWDTDFNLQRVLRTSRSPPNFPLCSRHVPGIFAAWPIKPKLIPGMTEIVLLFPIIFQACSSHVPGVSKMTKWISSMVQAWTKFTKLWFWHSPGILQACSWKHFSVRVGMDR